MSKYKVEIRTLGPLEIRFHNETEGKNELVDITGQIGRALFVYLVLEKGVKDRSWLDHYFRGKKHENLNQEEKDSKNRTPILKNHINFLKRGFEITIDKFVSDDGSVQEFFKEYFDINSETIEFKALPESYFCDTERFEYITEPVRIRKASTDNLEEAERLIARGEFMVDVKVRNSYEWDEWVVKKRSDHLLRQELLNRTLSIRYIARSNYTDACLRLEAMGLINPLADEVYGGLMLCYVLLGWDRGVINVFGKYETARNEYLLEQDPAVMQLLSEIQEGQLSQKTSPHSLAKVIVQIEQGLNSTSPFCKYLQELREEIEEVDTLHEMPVYENVLKLAEQLATGDGFDLVGTPHLFLPLCSEDTAKHWLQQHNLNLDQVAAQIPQILGSGNTSTKAARRNSVRKYTLELQNVLKLVEETYEQNAIRRFWKAILQREGSLPVQLLHQYPEVLESLRRTLNKV